MLLIQIVVGVVVIAVASSLRNCDDCEKLSDCTTALKLVRTEKTPETVALIKKALCGFDELPKVCCSDFLSKRSLIVETIDKRNNEISTVEEIENHPNIGLLNGECGDLEGNRIIGGTKTSLYEFPWMALIRHKVGRSFKFQCGGTVINSRYVLTAAHCIQGHKIVGVRIGDYDISSETDCVGDGEFRECESRYQDIPIAQTFYHNQYTKMPLIKKDIGLLRLARPIDFSYRNAGMICLPITRSLLEMNLTVEQGIVAGWGQTEKERKSDILLKVEVPIFSTLTCTTLQNRFSRIKMNKSIELENFLCAGEPGQDSCKGDSGGPLMVEAEYNETYKLVQFGIVSHGPTQCGSAYPGVYTDVRIYMKWILDIIKP